jgi:hypothetical protein
VGEEKPNGLKNKTAKAAEKAVRDSGAILQVLEIRIRSVIELLGFVKRLSCEFRDPYTLQTLYVSLVCPKFEYAMAPVVCSGLTMAHTSI